MAVLSGDVSGDTAGVITGESFLVVSENPVLPQRPATTILRT